MSRKLIVNDGRSERELLLIADIVVGRDPLCDISGDDALLSRRHAEFVLRGTDVLVRDLGSRNGVFVNGAKTVEGQLQPGDLLRIGHLQMQYVEDATPLASALAAAATDSTGVVQLSTPLPASVTPLAVDTDDERTQFVAAPSPPSQASIASANLANPANPSNLASPVNPVNLANPANLASPDEERTRFVRPPTVVSTGVAASSDPGMDESEKTRVMTATRSKEEVTARVADESWPSFVFAQVAILAAIVSAAVAAPFVVGQAGSPLGNSSFLSLAAAGVVVVSTAYLIAARIVARLRAVAGASARGGN